MLIKAVEINSYADYSALAIKWAYEPSREWYNACRNG